MNQSHIDCPDRDILKQFLLGQLSIPEIEDCQDHLSQCDPCVETVEGLKISDTFVDVTRQALRASSDRSPSDDELINKMISDVEGWSQNSLTTNAAIGQGVEFDKAAEVQRLLRAPMLAEDIGTIGHFRVLELIGAGSTGIVYLAVDTKLDRDVVLKVLRPSLGNAARKRFVAEAKATAAISHPNVVTIYEVGSDGPLSFISMRWIPGQTLEQKLADEEALPVDETKKLAEEIAGGLAAAHGKGLIHRDIKPANVWIPSGDEPAKILDFGLVRVNDEDPQLTCTGMIAGTPCFMSPEQSRGGRLDARSDLFSLGCLMYQSLTGRLPFRSENALATLRSVQQEQPAPPRELDPSIDSDLSDLVMCLLEKSPQRRPESAEVLIRALNTDARNWPFEVTDYSVQPKPKKQRTGTSWWKAIAAMLIGLAMATCGFVYGGQIIRVVTNQGEIVIDTKVDDVKIEIVGEGEEIKVIDLATDQAIQIKAGRYEIRPIGDGNSISIDKSILTLKRGETEIVRITRGNELEENQQSEVHVVKLKNVQANSAERIVKELLGMGSNSVVKTRIRADQNSNSIIVSGNQNDVELVQSLISELDQPSRLDPKKPHRIDSGDVLGIFIDGVLGSFEQQPPIHQPEAGSNLPPALGYPIVVEYDGKITLPFVDDLSVRGKTLSEVRTLLDEKYKMGKNPLLSEQVRIFVSMIRPRQSIYPPGSIKAGKPFAAPVSPQFSPGSTAPANSPTSDPRPKQGTFDPFEFNLEQPVVIEANTNRMSESRNSPFELPPRTSSPPEKSISVTVGDPSSPPMQLPTLPDAVLPEAHNGNETDKADKATKTLRGKYLLVLDAKILSKMKEQGSLTSAIDKGAQGSIDHIVLIGTAAEGITDYHANLADIKQNQPIDEGVLELLIDDEAIDTINSKGVRFIIPEPDRTNVHTVNLVYTADASNAERATKLEVSVDSVKRLQKQNDNGEISRIEFLAMEKELQQTILTSAKDFQTGMAAVKRLAANAEERFDLVDTHEGLTMEQKNEAKKSLLGERRLAIEARSKLEFEWGKPNSEPVYNARTYSQWLQIARKERDLKTLNSAIKGIANLASKYEHQEMLDTINQIARRGPGLSSADEKSIFDTSMVSILANQPATKIIDMMLEEWGNGTPWSRRHFRDYSVRNRIKMSLVKNESQPAQVNKLLDALATYPDGRYSAYEFVELIFLDDEVREELIQKFSLNSNQSFQKIIQNQFDLLASKIVEASFSPSDQRRFTKIVKTNPSIEGLAECFKNYLNSMSKAISVNYKSQFVLRGLSLVDEVYTLLPEQDRPIEAYVRLTNDYFAAMQTADRSVWDSYLAGMIENLGFPVSEIKNLYMGRRSGEPKVVLQNGEVRIQWKNGHGTLNISQDMTTDFRFSTMHILYDPLDEFIEKMNSEGKVKIFRNQKTNSLIIESKDLEAIGAVQGAINRLMDEAAENK